MILLDAPLHKMSSSCEHETSCCKASLSFFARRSCQVALLVSPFSSVDFVGACCSGCSGSPAIRGKICECPPKRCECRSLQNPVLLGFYVDVFAYYFHVLLSRCPAPLLLRSTNPEYKTNTCAIDSIEGRRPS